MWLKLGTRGDPRVIYVIIIGLILFGLHRGYYSLYNLNNGQEKQRFIVKEVNMIMPISDTIKLQGSEVTKHIGGGRVFETTLFSDLSKAELYDLFKKSADRNNWKLVENGEYFVKDNMKMQFKFVDIVEYNNVKHLQGKTLCRIKMEIK